MAGAFTLKVFWKEYFWESLLQGWELKREEKTRGERKEWTFSEHLLRSRYSTENILNEIPHYLHRVFVMFLMSQMTDWDSTGGLMILGPSGWHACTCIASEQCTIENQPAAHSGDGSSAASSDLGWHSCQSHLHPGCSQAITEHSSGTRASLLLPNTEFLQLVLWDSASAWPVLSQNYTQNCNQRFFRSYARSFPVSFQRCQLPSPAPCSFILHNHSPNKSLAHPALPSASQRTLPDTGHMTNSYQS